MYNSQYQSVEHVNDKFTITKIWSFIKQMFVMDVRLEVIRRQWVVWSNIVDHSSPCSHLKTSQHVQILPQFWQDP